MFHLTPQEKSALAWILTVCFVGAVICLALHFDARPLQWVNTATQYLPKEGIEQKIFNKHKRGSKHRKRYE